MAYKTVLVGINGGEKVYKSKMIDKKYISMLLDSVEGKDEASGSSDIDMIGETLFKFCCELAGQIFDEVQVLVVNVEEDEIVANMDIFDEGVFCGDYITQDGVPLKYSDFYEVIDYTPEELDELISSPDMSKYVQEEHGSVNLAERIREELEFFLSIESCETSKGFLSNTIQKLRKVCT